MNQKLSMTLDVERKTGPAGIWTPWAQVLCRDCHNQSHDRQFVEEELALDDGCVAWTKCQKCGQPIIVRDDVAWCANMVESARARGVEAQLMQTGGMCCSVEFPHPFFEFCIWSCPDEEGSGKWFTALMDSDGEEIEQGEDDDLESLLRRVEKMQQIGKLAMQFSRELHGQLTSKQMREVLRRNREEASTDICHSHDFLDANEVMYAAWKQVIGRDTDFGDADTALWNAAWDLAKQYDFRVPQPTIEQMRASKEWCGDLQARCPDGQFERGACGYVYLGTCWIEDTLKWDDSAPGKGKGRWYTICGNQEFQADDLASVEAFLWGYLQHELAE
jgi:hypothetical protein